MNYGPQHVLSTPLTPEQAIMYESGKKSVGIAILFGLLITGGGQFYAGRIGRGAAFMGAQIVCFILIFVIIGIPLMIANVIWSLFDAKRCVEEYNAVHLARITSGQIYQPEVAGPALPPPAPMAQPTPKPLAPARPNLASTTGAPPPSSQTPTGTPAPPPSSAPQPAGLPPASSSGRITLSEDDF